MKPDSFVFHTSDYQSIKEMTDAQLGKLFRSICEFAISGREKMDDTELKFAFNLLIDKMKRDFVKYEDICKKKSEMAKQAWAKHKQANAANSNSNTNSNSENVIFKIKCIFFFEKRICPVNQQFDIFWLYWCKRQWIDDNEEPISDKISFAKAWIPRKEAQTLCNEYVAALKEIYTRLEGEPGCQLIVTDLMDIRPRNGTLELYGSEQLHAFLQAHYPEIKDILPAAFKCHSVTYNQKK